jgi:hypothetical protein
MKGVGLPTAGGVRAGERQRVSATFVGERQIDKGAGNPDGLCDAPLGPLQDSQPSDVLNSRRGNPRGAPHGEGL